MLRWFPSVFVPFYLAFVTAPRAEYEAPPAEVFELKAITVKENKFFSDKDIKGMLGLEKSIVYDRYLFDYLLEKGIRALKTKYVEEGYVDAKVSWSFREVREKTRKLEIRVEEGERAKLAEVLLRNVDMEEYLDVRDNLRVDEGDPMAEGLLKRGASNLIKYYGDRGYAKARATYELDRETRTVIYSVEKGPVMTVGEIGVVGNVKTRPKIVTREIELEPGDIYNETKLIRSRENIYKTGLYKDVTIRKFFPEEDLPDVSADELGPGAKEAIGDLKKRSYGRGGSGDRVDILAVVREDKFRWVELKPGYGSPDRVTVSAGWGDNNFLFNNGQSLAVRGDVEHGFTTREFETGLNVTYTEPRLFSTKFKGVLGLFYERAFFTNYNYWQAGIEPMVIKELGKNFEFSGGLKAKRTTLELTITVKDPSAGDEIKRLYPEAGIKYQTSLIFAGVYNSKNDPFNPLKGNYLYVSEETAGGFLPSNINFYRIIGDCARFQQVSPRATIGFHARAGYVAPFGATKEVPAHERFFTGGGYSVRGFGERTLGPHDAGGDPIGGRILGYANIEFRFQLPFLEGVRVPGIGLNLGNFWGGFFLDGGNAWNTLKEIEKEKIRYSGGLGIRYNTPVGPLRFDFARPVDDRPDKGPGFFYLAFGHCF